jgi:hypothetical protein
VYFSTDGRFSVQYPRSWQNGTDIPLGYMMFWTRESADPFSTGFAVFSKSTGVWRPAQEVLNDYKAQLPSLMSSQWGSVTFNWDGTVQPFTLGGQLAMGEYGQAQSARVLAKATARDDGTKEYLALAWAPSYQWDSQRARLDELINTLSLSGF